MLTPPSPFYHFQPLCLTFACPPQASLSAGHGSRSTLDREFEKEFSRLDSDISFGSGVIARSPLSDLEHDLKFSSLVPSTRSPLNTAGHSASSSKTEKCSSSVSSTNGSWPHRESHHETTYRSTRMGDSGIPHSSYAHSSSSYDSERPYKNAVSNFSYNI